jgi:hypothetical protein
MYRPYSRCKLGEKCIERTNNSKVFTKYTFVWAITSSRILGWRVYEEGATNVERFVVFVGRLIQDNNLKGYLFIFDNAGAHKGQAIRQIIEGTGNMLIYSIPYNPSTNVIESWLSQFKHYMRTSQTRNFEQLTAECQLAIRNIKPCYYANYFKYAYRKNEYPQRERPRESSHN